MTDINVGQFSEALNDKADRDLMNVDTVGGADAVIEYQMPTAANNYTWYRKYKSGWVEQGGRISQTGTVITGSVTLPVQMADTNYTVQYTCVAGGQLGWITEDTSVGTRTTTTIYYGSNYYSNQANITGLSWEVKGIAA